MTRGLYLRYVHVDVAGLRCVTPALVALLLITFSILSCQERQKVVVSSIMINSLDAESENDYIFSIFNPGGQSAFVPKVTWINFSADTLFLESIYKQEETDSFRIQYNQFNPPVFVEIKPNETISRRLKFKYRATHVEPAVAAVRVYTKNLPYEPQTDYERFFSEAAFLEFEGRNSFFVYSKIENVDSLRLWGGCGHRV